MKSSTFRLILMCALSFTSFASHAAKTEKFGTPVTIEKSVSLTEAATQPLKQEVLINGKIQKVCKEKGCWMNVTDGKTEMRMTFKDYAFFVPKDSDGRSVRAQGWIEEKEESTRTQRHYLKDAGATKEEISAVKGAKRVKSFVASGVEIIH